jgi:F-type H+-transporting ATPase subunit b
MTIDWWTLGFQAVNVLILIALLQRFFWRPIAAIIKQRRTSAAKTMSDAEDLRAQAKTTLAEIDAKRAGFEREREAIVAQARASAETTRAELLAAAAKEAAAIEETAHDAMARESARIEKEWTGRAGELAVSIAERLAKRLDGPTVDAAFLNWLIAAIDALPDAARAAATAEGVELAVVSAAPLRTEEENRCRSAILAAIGGGRLVFKADPELIAGLELRGPALAIANSWRADLDAIRLTLRHDDQS